MRKILFYFLFILMTNNCFAADEITKNAASENLENQAVFLSSDQKIIPKSDHQENAQQFYTIDLNYPQISGKKLSTNMESFNKVVSNLVNQEVNQFKKYVADDMPHMKMLPAELQKNSLHLDYDIDVVKPSDHILVSVRLSLEGMQAGRAHPYHTFRVFTYDLATGKTITLNELFKPKSQYLTVIANFCKTKLNETLKDKWMIDEGTKPIAKNFKNWNIEDDDLLITFDEYQVAPYVYGKQEVEIPYVALKSIISPHSVIYPCVVDPLKCKIKVGP